MRRIFPTIFDEEDQAVIGNYIHKAEIKRTRKERGKTLALAAAPPEEAATANSPKHKSYTSRSRLSPFLPSVTRHQAQNRLIQRRAPRQERTGLIARTSYILNSPTPMDNSSTKGITIEVKRVTGLPSVTGPFKPRYYVTLNVNGISKSTKKFSQKDGVVEWSDQKLFFDTEITASSDFSLILFQENGGLDLRQVIVGLKGKDGGSSSLQVLLIFQERNIMTEMKARVEDAQRIATSGFGGASIADNVSSAVDLVSNRVSSTVANINPWKPVWTKFNAFIELAEKISEIHPYAKIASSVLLAAYHVWKVQKDRDGSMLKLLQTIHDLGNLVQDAHTGIGRSQREILQKIMEQIIDCSQFISSYCSDCSIALKAVKHIFSDVDDAIKQYTMSFDKLKVAFTDAVTVSTQLRVINLTASLAALRIDVNLNDMPYAEGARYKSGEGCIKGTRVKVLDDINHWVFRGDLDSRICLLLGPAGAGKSAIAHSVAHIFDHLGRLGSSFCFVRGDSSRRLQLYLPTLARDLAYRDPHIKKSLGLVIEDPSLRKTDDLEEQFEHLIAQTVKGCSIIGPILLVIDALDECEEEEQWKKFLKLLTNPEKMKELPSNFRIFITSRPDPDILKLFNKVNKVDIIQLYDKQYEENTDKDIFRFVHRELLSNSLEDITEDHCYKVVKKSEGRFLWASVACDIVKKAAKERKHPKHVLEGLLQSDSGLYKLYITVLKDRFGDSPNDPNWKEHFKRVLGFVLGVFTPLPKTNLKYLWRYGSKEIADQMDFILLGLGSLFNGIGDTAAVSPIHTSVRDFFTSPKDSGDFFINIPHFSISFGLLHILNTQLSFNICQIQTSYYQNSDIKGLKEAIQNRISPELSYACQFLVTHLEKLSDADKQDKGMQLLLKEFLEKKLLFWLEALGLLKKIDCAISCISKILPLVKFDTKLERLSRDAIKFIRMTSPVIEEGTPHLYLSAFNFIPENSILYKHFSAFFSQRARVSTSQEAQWPALEVTLTGHTSMVTSVAFSPDGQRVASGSDDKTIRIWNAHTGELVSGPFEGHTNSVTSVAFSPDGQRVVSGSHDKTIRIWNAYTGELVSGPFEGHTYLVASVAFSPDGQRV
ncbi:hypothetical protein M422DRAFT_247686, partial [Sphaerobolus stellatus SS14]